MFKLLGRGLKVHKAKTDRNTSRNRQIHIIVGHFRASLSITDGTRDRNWRIVLQP